MVVVLKRIWYSTMNQAKYPLTHLWIIHDNLKEPIRRGEYVAWSIAAKEPMRLAELHYFDFERSRVGIPSIFS
jgi:hypothetical protein